MKKIFSFMLIAVGLLISGNVKADVVSVTTYAELKSQIESATGARTINVGDDLTGDQLIKIMNGQEITLNLGGNTIVMNVATDEETNCKYGFWIWNGKLFLTGEGTIDCSGAGEGAIRITGSLKSDDANYSVLDIGEDVNVLGATYCINVRQVNTTDGKLTSPTVLIGGTSTGVSYGVVVNVDGYIEGTDNALWTMGNIKATDGQVPEITIGPNAEVKSTNSAEEESVAIGAMGYTNIIIKGTVEGGNCVYVKGGTVVIDGATLTATGDYVAPNPNGNGASSNGSAIVIDSHAGYGAMDGVTIKGDSKISSKSGYAIEEVVTKGDEKMPTINIVSGDFVGGEQGCVKTTEEVKTQILNNGTISGGTYTGSEIKDYIKNGNGVIDVTTSGSETVYVVNGMPSDKTWTSTIADAQSSDYVKITANEDVIADNEIAYLNIPGANKVTVKSGAKLSVGEAVLGADAVIEVEAGARLVVNGTNGLIAFETTNLVLKAAAGQPTGMFVLNPDVKANKQPWATLEYVSQAYTLGENEYMWEMFTNPFATILTASRDPEQPSAFQHVVNGEFVNFAAWGEEGDVRSAKPFELIAVTNTSNQTTDVKYTFTGQLQGSNDAAFSLNPGFNYLGNGYTALMNAKQVIAALQQSSENVRTLLYVWIFGDQRWKIYNGYKLNELNDVNPLTAFVLYADEAAEVNMDYEKLIWNANK